MQRGTSVGVGLLVLSLLEPAARAQDAPGRWEFRQPQMGTEFRIVIYDTAEPTAKEASDAAFARIAQLNAIFSDYEPDSELMRLCDRAGTGPVTVSPDLFRILERAQEIARRSRGAFDVTVGPVGRLWRRARRSRALPDPDRLAEARSLVGFENLVLAPDGHGAGSVTLTGPGMKLDLGGIAKGYAADAARDVLRERGLTRVLVAAAGDIAAGDPPPEREAWSVEVQALRAPGSPDGPSPTLLLARRNVSTSGDAEQFVEIDGRRYSHIVDPRTGVGVVGRSSVTVVADDGATADALATAVSVLGPDKGLALVETFPGAAASFVRVGDDGRVETFASKRWADVRRVDSAP